jgi:lipopolysaccharide export system permease protein
MINLQFFPSRRIAFYMARVFVLRSFAVLAALVVILMTLDLLGESGKILAYPGNGDAEVWRYASLRLPQLIARFMPFSVLLGTLIALATLNQHSEVVSMKAAGISAHQIIAPLIVASLAIAVFSFGFNERVVTRSNETLSAWADADYGPVPRDTGVTNNVWVRYGDDLILARQVRGRGDGTLLSGVTIYDRAGETLNRIIDARTGRRAGGGWRLEQVTLFNVPAGRKSFAATLDYGGRLDPTQFTLSKVVADQQGFSKLWSSIEQLKVAGRPTAALESGLWHKLAGPLSAVLMPLLAAVAAFGLARTGQVALRAVLGMVLGFAYFVADNFALAMGNLGAYPPLLAAWAPFLLFLLIGEAVLIRTEE